MSGLHGKTTLTPPVILAILTDRRYRRFEFFHFPPTFQRLFRM